MPLYQNYIFTTANQYVQDMAAFALANGWTLDFNGVYLTSYWRCHFHKGEAHFEIRSASATQAYISSCTGYTPATTPILQPGYSGGERLISGAVGAPYWLVSVVGGIYFTSAAASLSWGAVFIIQDKIGAWSGGWGFVIPSPQVIFVATCYGTTTGAATVYANGSWSAAAAAGGLRGTNVSNSDLAVKNQPMVCNGGLLPLPILLLLGDMVDSTKWHPLAYAPGAYDTSGGDIYNVAEELIIGGATYLLMPENTNVIGSTNGDILFKLGA